MFDHLYRLRDRASQLGDRINWSFWRAIAFLALIVACIVGYIVFYTAHDCYQTNHILYWSSTTTCSKAGKYGPSTCRTITYPVYETRCRH